MQSPEGLENTPFFSTGDTRVEFVIYFLLRKYGIFSNDKKLSINMIIFFSENQPEHIVTTANRDDGSQVVGGADYAHPRPLDDAPPLANQQVAENFEVIPNVLDSNSDKFFGFIIVIGISNEFVNGRYDMCDEKSSGASEHLVYKHELHDRYIFYDFEDGWKIGDHESLTELNYWFKSKN